MKVTRRAFVTGLGSAAVVVRSIRAAEFTFTPAAPLIADTFRAFGAEPVIVNSDSIYAALESGKVDSQEKP